MYIFRKKSNKYLVTYYRDEKVLQLFQVKSSANEYVKNLEIELKEHNTNIQGKIELYKLTKI